MGLWDSVTGFFDDIGDFFSGKDFFESAGYVWNDLMNMASDILIKNPTKGTYKETWGVVKDIYTTMDAIAVSLLVVFFLYGFCRDSCDLHSDLTFDKTIKMFIRLVITTNVLSLALTWMPELLGWGKKLTKAILGDNEMGFTFDGAKAYEYISDGDFGAMTAFLTSILFFLFTCVCGFMVVITVMNRILKIYMIAPFAGIALSTLAAGGQTAQVGYSYIKTFIGYVFSALMIAVIIAISSSFIDSITIDTENGIVRLVEYCLKMGAISSSVKMTDNVVSKAFGL